MTNSLTELLFPERGVRGAYVDIRAGIGALLGWRHYPADVLRLLGQALAATPLLASHSKFDGRINLQFQGRQALKLLVTQIDHQLHLRGMAKVEEKAGGDFQRLMGGGLLALMLEPNKGAQNYQGVVEIKGSSLAESLEAYFEQSEQLPTLVRLAACSERFCGFMLQRLPAELSQDGGGWEHLKILASTLGEAEMLSVDGPVLLHRLFHAETRRLFDPRPITLACRCSHAGISAMLLSLGEDELAPVLKQHGKVEVTCEFCGKNYAYSDVEVRQLYAAAQSQPEQHTKQ